MLMECDMLKNITIRTRLIFVLATLSVLVLATGLAGFLSLSANNSSIKTVYDDRVIALGQLDQVIRLINLNQLTIAKAISGDPEKIAQDRKSVV